MMCWVCNFGIKFLFHVTCNITFFKKVYCIIQQNTKVFCDNTNSLILNWLIVWWRYITLNSHFRCSVHGQEFSVVYTTRSTGGSFNRKSISFILISHWHEVPFTSPSSVAEKNSGQKFWAYMQVEHLMWINVFKWHATILFGLKCVRVLWPECLMWIV